MDSDTRFGRDTARRLAWLACAAASCALVACGGGGDAGAPAAGAPSAGVPAPPAASPSPAPATASTCNLPDFAASALARVNQYRAAGATCGSRGTFAPATALSWSNLQANNFFSHTGSNGSGLGQRVDATGYAWSSVGENIAAGYPTMNAVVDGWMASEGHCANLMNPNFNEFGLACVSGVSSNTYNTYWTMDLARSR